MSANVNMPRILSIDELLQLNLVIPDYQRPYKWTNKNITDLILDIQNSIEESRKYANFKYRIGTILLHKNEKQEYEIVDGQQRILSLLLLKTCIEPSYECALAGAGFTNKISQKNLHDNYRTIEEWLSSNGKESKDSINAAMKNILEVVVIVVDKLGEAFQLFDSQNSRGRALYPHDLLKAYHLREIHDKYEMQNAVIKWESKDPKAIRELFDLYLFPLWNWSKRRKCYGFNAENIDVYKGIEEKSGYTYAHRANKAMPYFLITEPFISGADFFEMVDHYMKMLSNIKEEIVTNKEFWDIERILTGGKDVDSAEEFDKVSKSSSVGFNHVRNLFFCALLCYYDRFHNFDGRAVKKLFVWTMMLRCDLDRLGFDSVNRYAIGQGKSEGKYSNYIPVISKITYARLHTEISGLRVKMLENGKAPTEKFEGLYEELCKLNGYN